MAGIIYLHLPEVLRQDGRQFFVQRMYLDHMSIRLLLRQGDSPVNGPHQGAWVDTADRRGLVLTFSGCICSWKNNTFTANALGK